MAETTKRKVAEKEFIDASGAVVPIEQATGILYKSLADGKTFSYQIPEAVAGSPQTMIALFGATTLATNKASQNRNGSDDDKYDSDVDAIADRFSAIVTGDWGTERGGGGRGINADVLLEAIRSAITMDDAKAAKVKARLDSDAEYRRTMRNHEQVRGKYDELMAARRPAITTALDDLLDFDDEPAEAAAQ